MTEVLYVDQLTQVPALRDRFTADLDAAGVAGDERDMWVLVFTELVNNSVEHGCMRPGDRVAVRWAAESAAVSAEVADPSPSGLTTQDFDEATCDGFVETGRGAGLFLIRAWVDEVYVNSNEHGTVIRIVKHRAGPGQGTER